NDLTQCFSAPPAAAIVDRNCFSVSLYSAQKPNDLAFIRVASYYIPALASVEGSKLGIAICTVDGQHYQAGDAHERFSIQSISKV
ncbi:glutaminase, partial [Salmonella enterica subsp. enterica serovar Cerro]|nr:glutaminase [Salmonella enterica subsp. enterica serovar Cerro]